MKTDCKIQENHLKSFGFKQARNKYTGKMEWEWGTHTVFTDVSPEPMYEPILTYCDDTRIVQCHAESCKISKTVSTPSDIDRIIDFVSYIMSK